ncbi:hypothetical protein SAMN02927924_00065 [Sphingobium faniae]|nr:hypothetical protein SAMN02927924_00065 [Sphingobium faniae]
MPLLPDDDHLPHQKTDAPDWRESYYCNFVDMNSDVCGLFWQGVRPNSQNGESVFLLFDDKTDIKRQINFNVDWRTDVPEQRRIVDYQTFTCLDPWNHWQVEYENGADRLLVDWKRLSKTCDWEWGEESRHFQAAGCVSVKGVVGGREIAFNGYGERDRAWGIRNYGPIKVCFFYTIQFPDDTAIHAFVQLDPETDQYRLTGYLHKDGQTRGLLLFESENNFSDYDNHPTHGRVRFVDDLEREVLIDRFEVINYLGKGLEPGGAHFKEGAAGAEKQAFLTFQRFQRSDGVLGRGMIDFNCWAGQKPTRVVAVAPPLYSTLYDFGDEK